MPHISDKRRLESKLASAMGEATLAMLLNPDSESEEDSYDLPSILAPVHDAVSDSRTSTETPKPILVQFL